MLDAHGEKVEVTLTPLGSSQLRRTSFPDCTQPVVDPQEEWIVRGKVAQSRRHDPGERCAEEGATIREKVTLPPEDRALAYREPGDGEWSRR